MNSRPSIVEVAKSRGIELRKIGREYKGRCPFHADETPSFSVSEEKGLYHCFGCGASGDVFNLVMKLDAVSFADAARSLGVTGHAAKHRPVNQTAVDMAAWANEQTARANSLLREIGYHLQLADELGWKEESDISQREWAFLEDLAEDLQTVKHIVELYENRHAIEELLADAEPDTVPPNFFPVITEEYREKLRRLVRSENT
jgi:DNA primase